MEYRELPIPEEIKALKKALELNEMDNFRSHLKGGKFDLVGIRDTVNGNWFWKLEVRDQ